MHQYRENIQVFEKQERPYIDGSFGVPDCCSSGEDHFSYISFLLIDGKRQYGLLMLEIEPEEISFIIYWHCSLEHLSAFWKQILNRKNIVTVCGKRMKY